MPYSNFTSQKFTFVFEKFQHTAFDFAIKWFWNMWIFCISSCFDRKGFLFESFLFIEKITLFWLLFNRSCIVSWIDDNVDWIHVLFKFGLLLIVFLKLLLCYGYEIALGVDRELRCLHRWLTCPTCSGSVALRWLLGLERRYERNLCKAVSMLIYHQFSGFVGQIDFVDVVLYLDVEIGGSLIGKRDDS